MKTLFRITIAALIVATAAGCDAFKPLNNSKKSAQGKPYELIVVCPQAEWTGEVGDSLRAIFPAPVPYLNQIRSSTCCASPNAASRAWSPIIATSSRFWSIRS